MERPSATSRVRTRKGKGVSVPRRFWTIKEEEALLISLEILRSEGMKCDGSFRGGYVSRLENLLEECLPGCGIIAKHVRSKLTVWKKTHTAIVTILSSSGAAGFSFDPSTHMLVEERQDACNEYKKVHPEGVKLVRGKSFPWLDRWNVLFGVDRATGQQSCDVGDAINELLNSSNTRKRSRENNTNGSNTGPSNADTEMGDDNDDATSITPPSGESNLPKTGSTSRRKLITEDPADIKILMGDWMATTRNAIGEVAQKLFPPTNPTPVPLADEEAKRTGLYDALSAIPGLSLDDVMLATHHLANNKGDLYAFWGMPEDVRGRYVVMLIERIG